jgi:hypothetical protein
VSMTGRVGRADLCCPGPISSGDSDPVLTIGGLSLSNLSNQLPDPLAASLDTLGELLYTDESELPLESGFGGGRIPDPPLVVGPPSEGESKKLSVLLLARSSLGASSAWSSLAPTLPLLPVLPPQSPPLLPPVCPHPHPPALCPLLLRLGDGSPAIALSPYAPRERKEPVSETADPHDGMRLPPLLPVRELDGEVETRSEGLVVDMLRSLRRRAGQEGGGGG